MFKDLRSLIASIEIAPFDARFFPHASLWAAMGALLVASLVMWSASSLAIDASDDWPTLLLGAWLFGIGVRYHNQHYVMPALYFILAYLILIAPLLGAATYLSTAMNFPLIDAQLAAFDSALGFDWPAHVAWVNNTPMANTVLTFTYNQLLTGMVATLAFLFITRRFERIREVMLCLGLMSICALVFVTFTPAIGAYAYYDLPKDQISNIAALAGRYHLTDFNALRDGSIGAISLGKTVGLVTFPSFHTITPVMCLWALRSTWAFWAMLPYTVLMVISTLAIGGHHLTDVIVALALCAVSAWAYARWRQAQPQATQDKPAVAIAE